MRVRATEHATGSGYTIGKIYDVINGNVIDDDGEGRTLFLGDIDYQSTWHEIVDDEPVASIPQPEFVDAVDFINKAAEYVGGSRAKTHGDKGTNFRTTAALHEGLDNAQEIADHALDPALQFALQMILAKMSRIVSGAYNPDDYVDIAGYAGCAGEIATQLDADGS